MPVYNGGKYIAEAIESILKQTFTDFELLIINDGSTDNSEDVIKNMNDPRIRYLKNATNLGLIRTLNIGINESGGKYIARMDQDDVSLPNRLEMQYDFMEKNQNIGISGGWAKTIGERSGNVVKKYTNPEDIKANLLFESAFIHPTVIMRKSSIISNKLYFDENFIHAEDKELWERASTFFPMANLNKFLLKYRVHGTGISHVYSEMQRKSGDKTIIRTLKRLSIDPSEQEIIIHKSTNIPKGFSQEYFLKKINKWFNKLIDENKDKKFFDDGSLLKILERRWLLICYNLSGQGFIAWKKYKSSSFGKSPNKSDYIFILKFIVRCALKKPPGEPIF